MSVATVISCWQVDRGSILIKDTEFFHVTMLRPTARFTPTSNK